MLNNTPKNTFFCFDIDDTLIHTNLANFLAYQKAIYEIKNLLISPVLLKNRCDKTLLSNFKLNKKEKEYIKILKDKYFCDFLQVTKINITLLCIMQILQKQYEIILLTNANPQRVELLVKYHNLKKLPMIFYNDQDNKYENYIKKSNLNVEDIIIFEDNDEEIKNAKKAGIYNIIKI